MLNYIELYWYIKIPHSGDVWLLQPHCPEALLWLGDSWSAWLVLALAVDMSWVVREKNAGSVGSSRFPHRSAGHGPVRGTARPWYGNDWPFGQSYQWWLRAKCVGETGKKNIHRPNSFERIQSSSPSVQTLSDVFSRAHRTHHHDKLIEEKENHISKSVQSVVLNISSYLIVPAKNNVICQISWCLIGAMSSGTSIKTVGPQDEEARHGTRTSYLLNYEAKIKKTPPINDIPWSLY